MAKERRQRGDGALVEIVDQVRRGEEREPVPLGTRHHRKARAAHPEERQLSDAMDVVLALWMRSGRQGKGNRQRSTASDLAHSRDKVQEWMDSAAEL